jgi:hypothetical protein
MGRETGRCPVRAASWLVLAAVVLGALFAGAGSPRAAAEWGAWIAVDQAHLRAEPGMWAEVAGEAWRDEWVTIHSGPTGDDWYEVSAPGGYGWIAGSLLAFGEAASWQRWSGDSGAPGERWIDVDRSSQTVTLYEGGSPLRSWWAAMSADGSEYGFFATALGTHYVYETRETLHWTDWGQGYITHWVGFDPDRLNGFHSWLLDENGWLVPGGDGPTGGCVALASSAAEELFWFVHPGMRVEVHW